MRERQTGEKEIFVWDEKKQKEQIDIIKSCVMESNQKSHFKRYG
jgi:hypothetical protein